MLEERLSHAHPFEKGLMIPERVNRSLKTINLILCSEDYEAAVHSARIIHEIPEQTVWLCLRNFVNHTLVYRALSCCSVPNSKPVIQASSITHVINSVFNKLLLFISGCFAIMQQ